MSFTASPVAATATANLNIKFPTGLFFVPSARKLVDTLFTPVGTASGFYRVGKRGIKFSRPNGEPWVYLCANSPSSCFFVSCRKQTDGRMFYMHSTSTRDAQALGIDSAQIGYAKLTDLANSIWGAANAGSIA